MSARVTQREWLYLLCFLVHSLYIVRDRYIYYLYNCLCLMEDTRAAMIQNACVGQWCQSIGRALHPFTYSFLFFLCGVTQPQTVIRGRKVVVSPLASGASAVISGVRPADDAQICCPWRVRQLLFTKLASSLIFVGNFASTVSDEKKQHFHTLLCFPVSSSIQRACKKSLCWMTHLIQTFY